MKKYFTLLILLFAFMSAINSQVKLDSIEYEKIKNQIRGEILDEIKSQKLTAQSESEKKAIDLWSKFSLRGYGVANYYQYNYDTDPNLKNKLDAERLNLYLEYKFNEKINFKSEIEFEHGGTGATLELDTQEEFGEYEQEIEKGGSVKIEQAHLNFLIHPLFNVRAGRLKVYFGLHQTLDTPTRYFTTNRQEMESEIIPLGWYENGLEFYGAISKKLAYRVFFVSGLDASGFSSRSWIKGGYQQKFELVNAESVAIATRLDYKIGKHKDSFIGFGTYINNAAANRPKNDLNADAYVSIFDLHSSYNEKNLRFNTIFLYGMLQNSDLVSLKNANLSNNLGVKRTPVGKSVLGISVELGYDVMPFIHANSTFRLYPFIRYDYYDTMFSTEGYVVKNPRWERQTFTGGVNWFVLPQLVIKAQYAHRGLGSDNYDLTTLLPTGKKKQDRTFSCGIGYSF
ncbi:MAG: hypothetical protein KBA06_00600 [Saprospiraceae bacterium]|nr:hypothetical protein [Saprospiraceae bacterium]